MHPNVTSPVSDKILFLPWNWSCVEPALHNHDTLVATRCMLMLMANLQEISEAYGVLSPDGMALRGLFIIDKEGVVQVGHFAPNNADNATCTPHLSHMRLTTPCACIPASFLSLSAAPSAMSHC